MITKAFIAVPECISVETIEEMRKWAQENGFEPVFATDVLRGINRDSSRSPQDITVYEFDAICNAIKECPVFFANLTPEASVEPGSNTTFMLGLAESLNKLIFSFTNTNLLFKERIQQWNHDAFTDEKSVLFDKNNMSVENFGNARWNLMLEGPAVMTGSRILAPSVIGATINAEELYSNISVFQYAVLDAQQFIEDGRTRRPHPTAVEQAKLAYLAGPDVFVEDFITHFNNKKTVALEFGITGLAPTDEIPNFVEMLGWADSVTGDNPRIRHAIFLACCLSVKKSELVTAHLTDFRGDLDSGTVVELGLAYGKALLNKTLPRIFGSSNSPGDQVARLARWNSTYCGSNYGGTAAATVCAAQPIRYVYGRMVDGALLKSGGSFALNYRPTPEQAETIGFTGPAQYEHLEPFKQSLAAAQHVLSLGPVRASTSPHTMYGQNPAQPNHMELVDAEDARSEGSFSNASA